MPPGSRHDMPMTATGVTVAADAGGENMPASVPERSPRTISDAVNCPSSRRAFQRFDRCRARYPAFVR